jgi:lysophospholipase L1-like esterase
MTANCFVVEVKGPYIVALSALLLCSCTRAHDPTHTPVRVASACAQEGIQLTIVGDSLARGWGASAPKYAFASLIYTDIRRKHPKTTMRNLGTPGATTDEIASEVPHIHAGNCSLVVIISGANDVQKLYTPSHFWVSYTKLLQKVRARLPHGALVVMGLPDVSLSPRIPWFLKPIESWLSKNADRSIAAAARDYGAAFVPLYALSHEEAYRSKSLLSNDGIHPNDEGYRIMAGAALPSIMMVLQSASYEGRE